MLEEEKKECSSCSNESESRINTLRFIDKLDSLYRENKYVEVRQHLNYWKNEALAMNDSCGLLTIYNEELGFARKVNDESLASSAIDEVSKLLKEKDLLNNFSGATILVNMATTLVHFSRLEEALKIYQEAKEVFINQGKEETYEYASLLNNMSSALILKENYDEAEKCILQAFDILNIEGNHDGEIGISLVNLAHLIYDRNENEIKRVEKTLDIAQDYLLSEKIVHDDKYAYALEKCIPAFEYFKRADFAAKLRKIKEEIRR